MHIDKEFVKYLRELEKDKKVDIQDLSATNKLHIDKMYKTFGTDKIFGRTDTEKVIGLKSAGTSKFLKMLLNKGIIEPVKGHGKGKYKFSI